ncbi:hypothetical protein LTR53_009182 [Teratosphaeriaceae sp. CCFEE 6253]|nr:hypothetical protein LTR53_009182 [Teratosphaeriaceae sp. CCFEE 6253]
MDASASTQITAEEPSGTGAEGLGRAEPATCVRVLHDAPEYSDLTIRCGEDTYRLHKAIVCARSPVLDAACRKARFREGSEGTIVLQVSSTESSDDDNTGADDPAAIRRMISYIYTGDYTIDPRCEYACDTQSVGVHHEDRTLSQHAAVFGAAVKYQISGLRALAAARYADAIDRHGGDHSDEDVAATIGIVHATTPPEVRELRDATNGILLKEYWLPLDYVVGKAIKAVDGLAFELMLMLIEERHGLSGVLEWYFRNRDRL